MNAVNASRILPFFLAIFLSSCSTKEKAVIPQTDSDNGGLFLPDGFGALVVADSVGPTRHLAVNDNGDIYVKLRIGDGDKGNVALRDTTGDGKMDIIQRFGDYLNDGSFATEMRIHNGYLYFSSELIVYRQMLLANQLIPQGKPDVLVIDHHPLQWHNAKSIAFDNKGGMYVTFSAPTNVCEDFNTSGANSTANVKGEYPCSQLYDQAGIWKFEEDKFGQTQNDGVRFATGLRSIVGITWNEDDDQLYAVLHGRDYLYAHAPQYYTPWRNAVLPAEEFIVIREGDDFGWPYSYFDPTTNKRMLSPEYGGDGNREVKGVNYADPLMGLPAHWAPNDLLFYKGKQFPERYRGGAFVAFHGSTNRGPYPQAGYIVAFIPFENGKPKGNWEVFADGFTGVDTVVNMPDARFRPMGLSEGPDGSLYISESRKGRIWRVVYTADPEKFVDSQLSSMEQRKSRSYIKTPDEQADNLSRKKAINAATLYVTHCLPCHQDQGQGIANRYPPLAGSEWVTGSNEKLISVLLFGQQGAIQVKGKTYGEVMPAYSFLNDQELAELINHIRNNFGNKGEAVNADEVALIRGKGK